MATFDQHNSSATLSSGNRFAADLRGFGPLGILAILVIVAGQIVAPLNAVLVLLWARRSHTPWREIGYVRPKSWIGSLVVGVTFGIVFKFLMKAIVMPLVGADSINQTYHFMVGNGLVAAAFIPVLIIKAGWGEETFFRGYLFERLGKLFGRGLGAKVVVVLVTSIFFGSLHYFDQGLFGAEQALISGLVFGTIFAVRGRIWTLMFAHAAFDLTALALIYLNLEFLRGPSRHKIAKHFVERKHHRLGLKSPRSNLKPQGAVFTAPF